MFKRFSGICILFIIAVVSLHAQTVQNLYMAGVSYNPGASPQVAGSALYGHAISSGVTSSGLYGISYMDILPNTTKPFTVTTNIGAGVAYKVATIDGVGIFIPTTAGITVAGNNTGWNWSGGLGIPFEVKKSKNGGGWYLMPNARFLKSSVSDGSGYQVIAGLLFGWGQ